LFVNFIVKTIMQKITGRGNYFFISATTRNKFMFLVVAFIDNICYYNQRLTKIGQIITKKIKQDDRP